MKIHAKISLPRSVLLTSIICSLLFCSCVQQAGKLVADAQELMKLIRDLPPSDGLEFFFASTTCKDKIRNM